MDPFLLLFIGVAIVVGGIVGLRLHAFIALFAAAIVVAVLTPKQNIESSVLAQGRPQQEATARANESLGVKLSNKFGGTATNLGVLIAMASIVGACLLGSGAAERIVRSTLSLFGEKRSPLVFATSGLVLGVPVFFDTVFLLLIPLARAMAARTQRHYLLYVLAIAVGTTMTHSLVPPTPGPLFVANALKVDIGVMIIAGLILSTFTAAFGLMYAWWADRRWPKSLVGIADGDPGLVVPQKGDHELPPLWLALAPIVIPVILIAGATGRALFSFPPEVANALATLGHPNIALSIAAVIALGTLAWQQRGNRTVLRTVTQSAIVDAGSIILITSAGGVFGGVLQETGVGERIQGLAREYHIGVLPLAFLVTALIRTAQGSATVAMVTSVGILAAFTTSGTLGFHPVYLALTIGCASKIVPWMNDSGFWVLSKTSGLTERETLRSMSVMFSLMGVIGSILVMIAAKLFPMV